MKKNLLTSIVAFGTMILAFSSCLGDSHNTMESGNVIAYITTYSESGLGGFKIADTGYSGAVTSEEINSSSFINGRFYEISFKIDSKNGTTSGIPNASEVKFVNTYRESIPQPEDKLRLSFLGKFPSKPSSITEDVELFPTAVGIGLYNSWSARMNDKFVFAYSCKIDKNEKHPSQDYPGMVEIVAYYDESNQKEGTSTEGAVTPGLKDHQIRVNLALRRTSTGERNPKPELETYTGLGVIDLSAIRREFENRGIKSEDENTPGYGYIQFQFTGEDKNDSKKTEIRTIGSFTEGGTGAIVMAFSNK